MAVVGNVAPVLVAKRQMGGLWINRPLLPTGAGGSVRPLVMVRVGAGEATTSMFSVVESPRQKPCEVEQPFVDFSEKHAAPVSTLSLLAPFDPN